MTLHFWGITGPATFHSIAMATSYRAKATTYATQAPSLGPETLTYGHTTGILSGGVCYRAAIVTAALLPGRENTFSRTNTFTRST